MNFNKTYRILIALALIAVMLSSLCACGKDKEPQLSETMPSVETSIPVDDNSQSDFLGKGLYIEETGQYIGLYMEDGTDEEIMDVLMIVLKNENELPLQYAHIELEYPDFTAEFDATNIPSGETVVLLEKNRHVYPDEKFLNATLENVVFFSEQMNLHEDKVKITGTDGAINVENLTDETLGEIYIYYKNASSDLLYGGITYRGKVEAGLAPGKTYTVMARHYKPNICRVVDVQFLETEE